MSSLTDDFNKDLKITLIILIIIGFGALVWGGFGLVEKWKHTSYAAHIRLIEECELRLPRDKHCHLIGVPDE
jgi:hypothetical protein